MKKAFTLIELLVVIIVLPAVTLVLSRVFATFIRDVPKMVRVAERNITVSDMIVQMRDDLDRAVALPDSFEAQRSDDHTLLIALPGSLVCYELQNGCGVRSVLKPVDPEARTWTFPEAEVKWSRWRDDEGAYAVEIHTLVRQTIRSQVKDKLANSYVLFVQGMGKGGAL